MGIEYLIVYASSFLIVAYVLSSNVVGALMGGGAGASTLSASSCFITPELPCASMSISSASGKADVELTDNIGTAMKFPEGSFIVELPGGETATGSCTPGSAKEGSKISCIAYFDGVGISRGRQLEPRFSIGYSICSARSCQQELNVTGSATLYAS